MVRIRTGGLAASVSLMALALGAATSVRAQAADPGGAGQGAGGAQLKEVVVTAERRVENLQTTPIAASVLDSSALDKKGVQSLADLQTATPALSITNTGLVANVNIRGIGLDSGSPQVVPGVSSYRDGLWQPPVTTAANFFDVASVEVLRGPQGTFVGSNSTGGAIFINSRNPEFGEGVSGNVEVFGGNYADAGTTGAVNLPINDHWAARVAFNIERRNSFYDDIGSKVTPDGATFNTPGGLDEKDLRVGLLWKPSEQFQALLKSEITDRSTGGYAMKPTAHTTYAPFAPPDPFTLNYDQNTKNDELTARNSLELKWQPSPDGVTFRSLTGYQYMVIRNIYDIDATNAQLPSGPPAQSEFQNVIERPISEEINILSPDAGRLTWIVGGYYLHDTREVGLDIRNQAFPPHVYVNLFTTIQDLAGFGQVSYKITPRLELQVGARYTHDSLENPAGNGVNIGPGVVFVPGSGSHTDNVWTGKAALNWTVNDDNFLYAFVAKGFKAGGFDTGFVPVQFKPEIVWDYEIGWKAYFLDRRIRTQIGGFWNNYQDLQVSVLHPASGMTSLDNVGKSTIRGVEAEIEGQFGGLRIDANGAYVDSKLGAITLVNTRPLPGGGAINLGPQCGAGMPAPPACFDYTPFTVSVNGRPNPYSPKWTFNAGVQYDFRLAGGATLTPRINYAYVGEQWTTLIQDPTTDLLASYGLWNATLTYRNGPWQVEGYAMNLANKTYVSGQFGNDEFYGAPRQFGARISRTF
jgi:iron complex outermembrane receptor protein